MKIQIQQMIHAAAMKAFSNGLLPSNHIPKIEIEEPNASAHGDFATNMAMTSASIQKMAPRKIAEIVLDHLEDSGQVLEKTEIAGPGFINFFINPGAWLPVLDQVHCADDGYGRLEIGQGQKIQVEFVSANPTGPLHVGHGRGAAVGDSLARLLSFCGYEVEKEYYINDSGRQIRTLGTSVYLRLKEQSGASIDFPPDCYQGDYIRELAAAVSANRDENLLELPEADAIEICARFAAKSILDGIRQDLENFGVTYEQWFSEQSLYDNGAVEQTLTAMRDKKVVYDQEGAAWFKTTAYGDEKDRVVVRTNGQTTYFASDIAYHQDKYQRGFDRVIDVWGADHHGYIARMQASIQAMGVDREQFNVVLVQLVNLLRGGQPVAMSTRAGEFVTLQDVIEEVGRDAARFIFLTRHYESPLDFDLELAKQKTNDNPVYYVQYVHARIASIMRKAAERGIAFDAGNMSAKTLALIAAPEEIALIKHMARFPEIVGNSAHLMEPHRITYFLMDLASAFHAYYNKHRVLSDDPSISQGRLYLVTAVQKVIRNGLNLLGVSAPQKM
jgi:arginyl-tRNA synthetase